jgi:putative ABC transport system permease protein
VEVGDQVKVTTLYGEGRAKLVAIADQINDGQGYIGYDTLEDVTKVTTSETVSATTAYTSSQKMSYTGLFNTLYLTADPDMIDEIRDDLYALPDAASVQSLEEARATYDLILALFYVFVFVMLIFSVAMAFALLYNGITITITERQREFATMRSLGASEAQIGRELIIENVIIWLIAIIPGCALGTWLAVELGKSLSTEWMNFRVVLDPMTYVVAALLILATMIIAGLPAFRKLRKVDLATGTKGAV